MPALYVCRRCDGHFPDIESKEGHSCIKESEHAAFLRGLRSKHEHHLSDVSLQQG